MMSIENFSAGVQYDDYKGSTAADNQDINNIYKYLEGKQLKIKDKVIVGISLDASHLSLDPDHELSVRFFLSDLQGESDVPTLIKSKNPLSVKEIKIDMSYKEFFQLFKRFNLTLSTKGLLENKDIDII
ncbi:hypothetical protein [Proteus mirabilis]|uniref:hypothetical protein n=2 Tax=Proteus mirabilis TaxID=584 RepID=UPI001C7C794B|nr:hypothetical protein [Proteus mirabilis]MDH7534888.1 hypothetical protein [Proteus mirabilis]MDM3630285.1 hypothetical protein [Proteus mirabilis]MDM3641500.1 hypothetical protein [Proteus mirabilis]MDM3710275.1 hypothetical protein [Proteus mirabilis]MDM3783488.1 hypothetical protein [Proteus mirabilis]